jgi:hypothetical protein
MSDAREFVLFGDHAENLQSGAMIAPGDRVKAADLGDEDQWLIDDGRLRDLADLKPTKEEIADTKAAQKDAPAQDSPPVEVLDTAPTGETSGGDA